MKSPITGKEMKIFTGRRSLNGVWYSHQYYYCISTGHSFTDTELDEGNLTRYEKEKNK